MNFRALLRRLASFAARRRSGAADAPVGQRYQEATEREARKWVRGEELEVRRPWWLRSEMVRGARIRPRTFGELLKARLTPRYEDSDD